MSPHVFRWFKGIDGPLDTEGSYAALQEHLGETKQHGPNALMHLGFSRWLRDQA